MQSRDEDRQNKGDLSITALYTAGAWQWSELPCANLVSPPGAERVFRATNAALGMARAVRKDLPSLRHSLAQRHAMIDHLVRTADNPQVLELAAGLSPRGAEFSARRSLRYVEVDLPALVAKKQLLLNSTDEGRAILARPNFRLVPGDVFEVALEELVDASKPVTVIVEGLFMYLDSKQRIALWSRLGELVGQAEGSQLVFDFVPPAEEPKAGMLGRAMESAMKRFTGGRGFERDNSTRDELMGELQRAGFDQARVDAYEPHTAGPDWQIPHQEQATQVVVWRCRR